MIIIELRNYIEMAMFMEEKLEDHWRNIPALIATTRGLWRGSMQ